MSGLLSACIFKDLCSVPTTFFNRHKKREGQVPHFEKTKGTIALFARFS